MLKKFLKRCAWYREARYLFRSVVHYRKLVSYVRHRFFIGPRIRHVPIALDRPPVDQSYSLHFLCAHRDVTMLLWSIASWYRAAATFPQLYIHEDGSFTDDDRRVIQRLLPHATIVARPWADSQAVRVWLKGLSAARTLRRDPRYVFAVKLMDPFFVSSAPARLLVDTDVLWFRTPGEVHAALREGGNPFFMQGGAHEGFQFNDGTILDARLSAFNAGIIGYHRAQYRLDDLEAFCARVGPHTNPYLLEQSGHAWILSRHATVQGLDTGAYIIKGSVGARTVAKHYTGPRREQFWFEGIPRLQSLIIDHRSL
jgi:hypothetical protein